MKLICFVIAFAATAFSVVSLINGDAWPLVLVWNVYGWAFGWAVGNYVNHRKRRNER